MTGCLGAARIRAINPKPGFRRPKLGDKSPKNTQKTNKQKADHKVSAKAAPASSAPPKK